MQNQQSPEFVHKRMSSIKGKDTKPEVLVRKALFAQGFRFRKNVASLPGKPDIVLPRYKVCIFVNGCFWHHHNCDAFVWPKRNLSFWQEKINNNVNRDERNYKELESRGWRIIVVWECELKKSCFEDRIIKLKGEIKNI